MGRERDEAEARRTEWRRLQTALDPDPPHSDRVALLALGIFDDLVALHGLGAEARTVLEGAALLHDVGWSVSREDHNKHSHDIVAAAVLVRTPPGMKGRIALLCRYHRGKPPREEHRDFGALSGPGREEVRRLSALLRIADALDRGHRGAAAAVSASDEGKRVVFLVRWAPPAEEESLGFAKKKDLFEEVFGREAVLAAMKP